MINTLTLNPAIDHICYLGRFRRNVTNRLSNTAVSIGGKGTHVSVNLALMGTPSRAFGFSFGENGRRILKMLENTGVTARFIHREGKENRDNYLLVEEETRDCTLIVQKGPQPDDRELAALFELLAEQVEPGDDLLLSGDASNFPGRDVYGLAQDVLSGRNLRVFLDASGLSLKEGVKRKPFLIKPNLDELETLTGTKPRTDGDVVAAIRALAPLGIAVIAVSLGGEGSIVRTEDRLYRAHPPAVRVYNTVGCGDCYLAGMMHGFQQSMGVEDALRFATAVSAANAESPLSVGFDKERAEELLKLVQIERI